LVALLLIALAAVVLGQYYPGNEFPYKDRLGSDPHHDPLTLDNGQLKVPPLGWSGSRYYRCIENVDGTSIAEVWNIPSHKRGGWYYTDLQQRFQSTSCGAGPESVYLTYDVNARLKVIGFGNTPQSLYIEAELLNVFATAFTPTAQSSVNSLCNTGCCFAAPLYNKTVVTACSPTCPINADGTYPFYTAFAWSDAQTFTDLYEVGYLCSAAALDAANTGINAPTLVVPASPASWHYAAPYGNGTYRGTTVEETSSSMMVIPALVMLLVAAFALI